MKLLLLMLVWPVPSRAMVKICGWPDVTSRTKTTRLLPTDGE